MNIIKERFINQKTPLEKNEKNKANVTCNKCGKCYESRSQLHTHIKEDHKQTFHCSVCDFKGKSISVLDEHISIIHNESSASYQCSECNEMFMSEWRLKKHKRVHEHGFSTKFCHYYNNLKFCPYEKFGCKFKHSDAEMCKFDKLCKRKLCPFKHRAIAPNTDDEAVVVTSNKENDANHPKNTIHSEDNKKKKLN